MFRRVLLCVALVLAGVELQRQSLRMPRRLHRADLQQDRGFPARLDPGGHHRDPAARRRRTTSRSRRPRTPPSSTTPTWPGSRRSSGCPPPATCSTPPSRPRSSATSAPAAATSACTPRPTPSTTGRGTATWSARTSPATRRSSTATVRIEDTVHPSTAGLPAAWSRTDEWYNYRTNPRSTVHVLATLDESTYTRRHDGRRPPDRLVPRLRRRPLLVHRPRATPRRATARPTSAPTCSAASGTRPRAPATARSAAAARRPLQPGDAGQGRGRDRASRWA